MTRPNTPNLGRPRAEATLHDDRSVTPLLTADTRNSTRIRTKSRRKKFAARSGRMHGRSPVPLSDYTKPEGCVAAERARTPGADGAEARTDAVVLAASVRQAQP